jgi:hypothetical protein
MIYHNQWSSNFDQFLKLQFLFCQLCEMMIYDI